jgi:hypothetical protein
MEENVTDSNDSTKKLISQKVKGFNSFRKSRLLETKINAAYLTGNQNIEVVNGAIKPLSKIYVTNVVANKILPAVVNDIAVATKAQPKFDIVPAGSDEDDKATAKVSEKILPYLQRINDPHLYRRAVILWYDLAGSGWRKVYWNPYYRVIGRNPPVGDQGHNPEMEEGEAIFQGEVVVEPIPNTELIFDWRQKNIRNLKWIIHHTTITYGEVRERFGEEVAQSIPNTSLKDRVDDKDSFEVSIMGDLDRLSQDITSTPSQTEDLIDSDKIVEYYEFWHLRTRNMPHGSYAVLLGDISNLKTTVMPVDEPYPIEQYPHGELPIIGADPIALTGIMPGSVPRISQARPLQREYNEVRSRINDNIDAMGNSVILSPKDANLNFKKLDNQAGNIVEYEGMMNKPTREPGVPVPSAAFAHLELIRRDIDEIFAFHEPSKGIMPEGGPRSAIGLQTLQEADATQLSPMARALDEADERVVYQMLSLAVANYGDRMIQVVGKDNKWTLEKISAEELNGKINVIVRTGSSLPLSRTLEQEKTVFAWTQGLLGNPQDPTVRQKVLKALDLGSFEQILQDNAKHQNFAQLEFINAEKLAMQMPPMDNITDEILNQFVFVPDINSFDDHYVHQQEHSNFILDKYYEYIGSGQPQFMKLAMAMVIHNQLHAQAIQEMMLSMAMLENPQAFKEDKPENKSKGAK